MEKIKYTYFVIVVTIITILLLAFDSKAQEFTVQKLSGKVSVLKGTSEEQVSIQTGDRLSGNDVLITNENSFVQLSRGENNFILRSNSALGLNHIKKVSINDLLLALTIEEIRNLPKNNPTNSQSTAVYGTEISSASEFIPNNLLGIKKMNGAKQLAENGFEESAVIVAKETYRKHPATRLMISERIYFADILNELDLHNEALAEYKGIGELNLNGKQRGEINSRIEKLSLVLSGSK